MTNKMLRIWKRSLGIAMTGIMAAASFPTASFAADAENPAFQKPVARRACSLSVSEEHVTENEPFASYTAGSRGFRIPTLIALENGDLLGTADARWERFADGGGLDTIASVSSDGGKTWHYSFPFFFPDSNGFSGNDVQPLWSDATTIIDSCVLEGPDGTVYCFADVNPTGATTLYQNNSNGFVGNNPNLPYTGSVGTGTGYVTVDGKRRLALTEDYTKVMTEPSDSDTETYPYYVGDFTDGYAQILTREGSEPTGFGVDEWYNLYTIENGTYIDNLEQDQVRSDPINTDPIGKVQQNVYYAGSKFHIYCVAHIWMVTSKDHGRTWTNPVDINDQVKRRTNEHAILVSPGQGMVTSDGTIAFGVYDNGGNVQGEQENASIVYSSDRGKTWKRTNDVPDMWSSENEIVEIADGKGTLRMFFRNGNNKICYADAEKDENGEYQFKRSVITDVQSGSSCNVSAISYSEKIDGKQAVMVACPSTGRSNGKIYTFLVNDDALHTMELKYTFAINSGGFAYCCVTEQADGSIALIWENGNQGGIRFNSYDIADVVPGGQIENASVNVEVAEGDVHKIVYDGKGEVTSAPEPDFAEASIREETYFDLYDHSGRATDSSLDSFVASPNQILRLSDAEFTFTGSGTSWQIKNDRRKVWLKNDGAASFFDAGAADMKVSPVEGKDAFYICQPNDAGYVIFHAAGMNFNRNSGFQSGNASYELALLEKQKTVSGDDIIPGYRKASDITSGRRYLIARIWDENNIMILYPVNGVNEQTKRVDLTKPQTSEMLVFEGISEGHTQAVIDGVTYRIQVTKEHPQPDSNCPHTEKEEKNKLEASCTTEGYTGDTICLQCDGIVEAGESIPASGHKWDRGSLNKAVTETENGEWAYRCRNDRSHTKTEIVYSSAYTELMEAYRHAMDAKEKEGLYTAESSQQLLAAIEGCGEAVEGAASSSDLYETTDALQAANAALVRKSLEQVKQELDEAIAAAAKDAASSAGIPADVWNEFAEARSNAEGAAQTGGTADELWPFIKALTQAQQKLDAAKQELSVAKTKLADAVGAAKSAYDRGEAGYTADTWKAFSDAYHAAGNPPADADVAALQILLDRLQKAQAALVLQQGNVQQPGNGQQQGDAAQDGAVLKEGDVISFRNVDYVVLDAAGKTVSAAKCSNAKASSVTIPDAIDGKGTLYKVVQIGEKAFSGCKKLKQITIGANVTSIGKQAFGGCKKLGKVTLKGSALKSVGKGAFQKTSAKMTVTAPKKMKKAQKSALLKKMKSAGMSKKAKIK